MTDATGLCPFCIPLAIVAVGVAIDYLMDPTMFVPKWQARIKEVEDIINPPPPPPPRPGKDWPNPYRDPSRPVEPRPTGRNMCQL